MTSCANQINACICNSMQPRVQNKEFVMKNWMRTYVLVMGLLMGSLVPVCAQAQVSKSTITPEQQQELWQQPDFVKAYLMVADPGNAAIYRVFGHSCIHLECPAYGLDYTFHLTSEDVEDKLWRFMKGQLLAGIQAIPTQEYINGEPRALREYEINLPIDAKRKLWEILDNHVMKDTMLVHDYFHRGCTVVLLGIMEELINQCDTLSLEYGPWPEHLKNQTVRDIIDGYMKSSSWTRFFVHSISGGREADGYCPIKYKVMVPVDLVRIWQNAKVNGRPLLSQEYMVVTTTEPWEDTWFTPLLLSLIILGLAIISWFMKGAYIDWFILGIQFLFGCGITYLLVFSQLPLTGWSWLIIPFNPLALIFWKWRKKWSIYYAGVLVLWVVGILVWPHVLVDNAHLVLTAAWIIVLAKNALPLQRRNNTNFKVKKI